MRLRHIKTRIDYIQESIKKHGEGNVDYSKTNFTNISDKNKKIFICLKHNKEYPQTLRAHLYGNGCVECSNTERNNTKIKDGEKEFYEIVPKLFPNYDFSESVFKGVSEKITYYCPLHGYKTQLARSMMKNMGCDDCGHIKLVASMIENNKKDFKEKAHNIHNNRYKYDMDTYKGRTKVMNIICPIHGVFQQTPRKHLYGQGCRICKNKTEGKLYVELSKYYNVIKQPTFEWCKNIETNCYLPFDFLIPELNILIELDGIQHFKVVKMFKTNLPNQRKRDLDKQKHALNNNYSVIRVYQQDVCYDTFNWLEQLIKSIEKIKIEQIIQTIYISKENEYENFENVPIQCNQCEDNKCEESKFCEICNVSIKHNFKRHETTIKHKQKICPQGVNKN
jgi:very-short-patch-repair endonuclease